MNYFTLDSKNMKPAVRTVGRLEEYFVYNNKNNNNNWVYAVYTVCSNK